MSISKDEVKYVAGLARLEFDEDEIIRLEDELSAVLDYAESLNKYDVEGIKPTEHILPIQNVYREDVVEESLPLDEALKNAPEQENGAFKVPRVVE